MTVYDVVQSRAGTLFAAIGPTPAVAALDTEGHERWRVTLPDSSVATLVCNRSGDVWAFGTGVTRVSSTGSVLWHSGSYGGGWRGAVDANGQSYLYTRTAGDAQVQLQAIAQDGTLRWLVPLGGTWSTNQATPTVFAPPAVGPSGVVHVPRLIGKPVVVGLDAATGNVVTTASSDVADASGFPTLSALAGVVVDAAENVYYSIGAWPWSGLVSATVDGTRRWASDAALVRGAPVAWTGVGEQLVAQNAGGAAAPVLLGSDALVGSSQQGLVDLSPGDGSVRAQSPTANKPALTELLAGSLRVAAMTTGAGPIPGGTMIVDSSGKVVWSDPDLNAASVIPGAGVLYAIRHGQLVAESASVVTGLDTGAWPMVAHDPGRTSSAAGAW
ncbi:MAG TPA: hypothetical protein VF765_34505 [Polyangiaceae bacterium]